MPTYLPAYPPLCPPAGVTALKVRTERSAQHERQANEEVVRLHGVGRDERGEVIADAGVYKRHYHYRRPYLFYLSSCALLSARGT